MNSEINAFNFNFLNVDMINSLHFDLGSAERVGSVFVDVETNSFICC